QHTPWGAFSFKFIFMATDLTERIFVAQLARRIILALKLPALFVSNVVSAMYYQGEWQGFDEHDQINLYVALISSASFKAYALG
ncbi:VUT family protein, partial [Erwinia amylovora]|uniref:VUT family protein n=1 Tax=Erwinia amylovora TaxID=552 RepID=UPI002009EA6C